MCPKGDDPFTISKDYRSITISTGAASGSLDGLFKFSFGDFYIYFPADATQWTSSNCEDDIQTLSNVEIASCSRSSVNARMGAIYTIQLKKFPMFPMDSNIYSHNGDPPHTFFKCETYKVTSGISPYCTISDIVTTALPGIF